MKEPILVTDFGAIADGAVDCAKAFNAALVEAWKRGQDEIIAEPNTYLARGNSEDKE